MCYGDGNNSIFHKVTPVVFDGVRTARELATILWDPGVTLLKNELFPFPDLFNLKKAKNVAHKELDRGGSNTEIAERISAKLFKEYDNVLFLIAIYDQVWGYHEHTISYRTSRTIVEYRYQGKNYVIYGTPTCEEGDDACYDANIKIGDSYEYGQEGFQKVLDSLPSGPDGSKKIVEAAEKYFEPSPPMILVVKDDNNFAFSGTEAAAKVRFYVTFDGDEYVLVLGYE